MPVIFFGGDDTEAFLGLAENLYFQKYDVTLLVCGGGDDFAEEQIIGLPCRASGSFTVVSLLTEKRRKSRRMSCF